MHLTILMLFCLIFLINANNMDLDANALDAQREQQKKELDAALAKLLKGLPAKDGQWCERMANGKLEEQERKQLEQWTVNQSQFLITPPPDEIDQLVSKLPVFREEAGCPLLHQLLPFPDQPLSEEERQFPLAYGLLVHKSAFQVMALMSAIYQPQNAYCLVVDEKADEHFKKEIQLLADCFPNVFLMSVGKIHWCKFGIVRAVFGCLRYLAELRHGWRYFQYLSGVDLPLKTNLEMVRIFKRLNGTVNADVLPFEDYRISGIPKDVKPPLKLWKSSLSALVSREAADAIVGNGKVRQLMRFLQYTNCSDESIWATIAGNPRELQIPGGFDAASLYENSLREANLRCNPSRNSTQPKAPIIQDEGEEEPFRLSSFYVSRYQLWNGETHPNPLTQSHSQTKCYGKYASSSCVFGIGDVPLLLRRPELVAHKLYLDFQPAAYFCVWKTVRERALDWRSQRKFQGRVYAELPTVRAARGEPIERLQFFFDSSCHLSISK